MMKGLFFFFWLCISLLFWKEMPGEGGLVKDPAFPETVEYASDNRYEDLAALWSAHQVADLSLQQNNPFYGQNTFRRSLSSRVLPDRNSFFLSRSATAGIQEVYQKRDLKFRDYFSFRQLGGYYIYTLRRIII